MHDLHGSPGCRATAAECLLDGTTRAEVVAVTEGSATLKDAINAAMRDWSASMDDTHYALGLSWTSSISNNGLLLSIFDWSGIQRTDLRTYRRLPDRIYACVGGGSNASGLFLPFLEDDEVELVGVEAGGHGVESGAHAARFSGGNIGVAQGYKTYFLQIQKDK